MAEGAIEVPSAVVIPELAKEGTTLSSNALKRRGSSASSSSSKRLKVQTGNDGENGAKTAAARRIIADVDERKRGKRLFGGLLGTLSQNSASSAQKRRTDIDRKQREKLRAQADEDQESKKQRLEKVTAARKVEQVKWDRQATRTRHENERTLARFLRTSSRPVLYYKPWELRPEEEELIRQQIFEVERDNIAERVECQIATTQDFDMDLKPGTDTNQSEVPSTLIDNSEKQIKTPLVPETAEQGTERAEIAEGSTPSKPDAASEALKDHMDETGEDVVQGDEDAVLY